MRDAPDIIGTANHGPLFADAPPTVAVSGGSALALQRIAPKAGGMRARVLAIYAAIGPATRNQCAAVLCGNDPPTPEAMNTVQGRTHELLVSKHLRITGYEKDHGRGLLAVTPAED